MVSPAFTIPISDKCRKTFTVIGACLALSAVGFPWYWGNLSIYATSYSLIVQPHVEPDEIVTPWPLPLWVTTTCAVIFLAGQLSKAIGVKRALLCGIVLQNVGMASVYFVIGNSTFLFNVCTGVLSGLGSGCVIILMMQIVIEWADHRAGLYIGIIRSCMVIGAVVVNQSVTFYLNPGNKTPDVDVGSQRFFSDTEITERVPILFLALSAVFLCVQLIGLVLVSERRKTVSSTKIRTSSAAAETTTERPTRVRHNSLDVLIDRGMTDDESVLLIDREQDRVVTTALSRPLSTEDLGRSKKAQQSSSDLRPAQILRTVEFYTLSVTMALGSVPYVAVNNYYKSYGQVWIHDDYFLTILGDILIAITVVAFVSFGYLLDRFGVKLCLVIYFGTIPFACLLFYFSPMINKWLFCLFTFVFGGMAAPLFVLYSTCVSKAFGKTHFSRNYGLVTSLAVVLNLVSPVFLGAILEYSGWFYLFFVAAILAAIALILVIVTLQEH